MYESLGISLALAALLTINAVASLAAAGLWRLLERPMRRCSARTRAEVLFAMRVGPGGRGDFRRGPSDSFIPRLRAIFNKRIRQQKTWRPGNPLGDWSRAGLVPRLPLVAGDAVFVKKMAQRSNADTAP